MEIEFELVRQVNSRWHDGRSFAGMPGRRVTVDGSDADAVAHMRHLVYTGDAVEMANKIVDPPTNEELREDLRERGLPTSGNKDALTDRIADDDAEQAPAKSAPRKAAKGGERA